MVATGPVPVSSLSYPDCVSPDSPTNPDPAERAFPAAEALPAVVVPSGPGPGDGADAGSVSPDHGSAGRFDTGPVGTGLTSTGSTSTGLIDARRPRSRTVRVLSVLLVVAVGLAGYLVVTTRSHERASERWRALAQSKADALVATQQELDGATSELTAVRDQLATATARITELANEKAQIGDEVATQQQLSDYQQRVSAAAATVASALDRCVTAQQKLIGYLGDAAAYDPADLDQFATDVGGLCSAAQEANTTLQTELAK